MWVINSESLSELSAVAATPKHFDQIGGQEEQEADRPQQIIDETNHSRTERKRTSVAPYFFCRFNVHGFTCGIFSLGHFSRTKTPPGSSNSGSASLANSFSVNRSPDFMFW